MRIKIPDKKSEEQTEAPRVRFRFPAEESKDDRPTQANKARFRFSPEDNQKDRPTHVNKVRFQFSDEESKRLDKMAKARDRREQKKYEKAGMASDADALFDPIKAVVLDYLNDDVLFPEKDEKSAENTQESIKDIIDDLVIDSLPPEKKALAKNTETAVVSATTDKNQKKLILDTQLPHLYSEKPLVEARITPYKYQKQLPLIGNVSALEGTLKVHDLLKVLTECGEEDVYLYDPLLALVLKYLAEVHPEKNRYRYHPRLTFLGNTAASYAHQIAHNLLWHINIEETLELAKQQPTSLLIEVEVKDPHGQRIKGTPLQIVAAAGDRNPRKLREELYEEDFGLVERLRPCFPNPNDYEQQLKDWFERDSEQDTQKTLMTYVNAIKTFCQELIDCKEITPDPSWEKLLQLPIVEKFKKALIPAPDHVMTSGLLFDLQIFHHFFEIWNSNKAGLGEWLSPKHILFAEVVYPTLQARVQRVDLEILKGGIISIYSRKRVNRHLPARDYGPLPEHIDFSNGIPDELKGLGDSFFFDFEGQQKEAREVVACMRGEATLFLNLASSKNPSEDTAQPCDDPSLPEKQEIQQAPSQEAPSRSCVIL